MQNGKIIWCFMAEEVDKGKVMFFDIYVGISALDTAAALGGGVAAAVFAVQLYMTMPAGWLCEFDELPGEIHMPGFRGAGGMLVRSTRILSVFLAAVYVFGVGGSVWGGVAVVFLAAAAFSDMDYMIIPDQMMWAAAACSLAAACEGGWWADAGSIRGDMGCAHFAGCSAGLFDGWTGPAVADVLCTAEGALTGGGLMLISAVLSAVFYGAGAIGTGDIKMMLVCGALTGSPEEAAVMFAAAIMSSALFITVGLLAGYLTSSSFVPMAPFIALATVLFM